MTKNPTGKPRTYTCKRCGAAIIWLPTRTHSMMPVNAATVIAGDTMFTPTITVQVQIGGNWRFKKIPHHVAHWSTCPHAKEFRKTIAPKAKPEAGSALSNSAVARTLTASAPPLSAL